MAKSYLRYPDNWIVGTRELALDERGAYCDLLDLFISRDGNLPDEYRKRSYDLACDPRTWKRIRQALIDAGKIEIVDGIITPTGGVETLQQCHDRSEKARIAAENRWRKNRLNPPAKALAKGLKLKLKPEIDADIPLITNETPDALAMPIKTRHIEKKDTPPVYPKNKGKKATRIADDWEPDDDLYAYAIDRIGAQQTNVEIEKFRDHFKSVAGNKGLKRDWSATWRNWVRRQPEFAGSNRPQAASLSSAIGDAISGGTDQQGLHADRLRIDDADPRPGSSRCDNDAGSIIDAVATRRNSQGIDPAQSDDQVEEHGTGGTVDDDERVCG